MKKWIRWQLAKVIYWALPHYIHDRVIVQDYNSLVRLEIMYNELVIKTNNLIRQNEQLTIMYRDIAHGTNHRNASSDAI